MRNLILVGCLLSVASLSAQTGAALEGIVRDETGTLVPNASVQIQRVRTIVRDQIGHIISQDALYSGESKTGSNGNFAFSSVPVGDYYVCAHSASAGYISNCDWNWSVPKTHVSSGSVVSGILLTITKGTIIQVDVSDPNARLTMGHHFYPGVMGRLGYYAAARLSSQNAAQRAYSVTIPKTETVRLFVDSDVPTTAATGESIPTRVPSSVTLTGGSDVLTVMLNLP